MNMEKEKKGFWINFTFKRLGIHILLCFLFLFFIDFIIVYVFKETHRNGPFSAKNLLAILLSSSLIAFFITLWTEKSEKTKWFGASKSENKA